MTSGDTRTQLLDAAMKIVAERGLQALTHRGVEARVGVAHGVTTYHFQSREAMIGALLRHISDRQFEWITRLSDELAALPIEERARSLQRLVEAMMGEPTVTLARYELYLQAARDPQLQDLVRTLRQRYVALYVDVFRQAGAVAPEAAANRMLSAIEGLMIYQLSAPEAAFQAWAPAYLLSVGGALIGFDPGAPPAD